MAELQQQIENAGPEVVADLERQLNESRAAEKQAAQLLATREKALTTASAETERL